MSKCGAFLVLFYFFFILAYILNCSECNLKFAQFSHRISIVLNSYFQIRVFILKIGSGLLSQSGAVQLWSGSALIGQEKNVLEGIVKNL
jgi:hypothetical protein